MRRYTRGTVRFRFTARDVPHGTDAGHLHAPESGPDRDIGLGMGGTGNGKDLCSRDGVEGECGGTAVLKVRYAVQTVQAVETDWRAITWKRGNCMLSRLMGGVELERCRFQGETHRRLSWYEAPAG